MKTTAGYLQISFLVFFILSFSIQNLTEGQSYMKNDIAIGFEDYPCNSPFVPTIPCLFQPVQVLWLDDPPYPPNDLVLMGSPSECKSTLEMVQGKNTYIFGINGWFSETYEGSKDERAIINIPVLNYFTFDAKITIKFSLVPPDGPTKILYLSGVYTIPAGTPNPPSECNIPGYKMITLNAPIPETGPFTFDSPGTNIVWLEICDVYGNSIDDEDAINQCGWVRVNVKKNQPLFITVIPLIFSDFEYPANYFRTNETWGWNREDIREYINFLFDVYPVSENGRKVMFSPYPYKANRPRNLVISGNPATISTEIFKNLVSSDQENVLQYNLTYLKSWNSNLKKSDRLIVSDMKDDDFSFLSYYKVGAKGFMFEQNKHAVIVQYGTQAAYAHEIGHSFGLRIGREEYDPSVPNNNGGLGLSAQGYWVNEKEFKGPDDSYCFMGKEQTLVSKWIDREDYKKLLIAFGRSKLDPEAIEINGIIHNDNSAAFLPGFRYLTENMDLDVETDTTQYFVRLKNDQGQVIRQYGFNGDFTYCIDYIGIDTSDFFYFSLTFPYDPLFRRIELCDSLGNVMTEKIITQNIPEMNIISPNGGETYDNDSITMQWNSGDIDGDTLYHYIYISEDTGQTWFPVSGEVLGSEYTWCTRDAADGSAYKIMVIVTDGVNTARDSTDGTFTIHPTAIQDLQIPGESMLSQNYPNPFSESTILAYHVVKPCFVTLEIYDLVGKRLISLVSEYQNSGDYRMNLSGDSLPGGIYFYRLTAGGHLETKRFVLIK